MNVLQCAVGDFGGMEIGKYLQTNPSLTRLNANVLLLLIFFLLKTLIKPHLEQSIQKMCDHADRGGTEKQQ